MRDYILSLISILFLLYMGKQQILIYVGDVKFSDFLAVVPNLNLIFRV
jgi:hypothetical protein